MHWFETYYVFYILICILNIRRLRLREGHSYSDFVNVTLGMVDRQSKHIPPAIHELPSEINPFWLVLPDQEVVYRTYTAPFTLSTVLPLVFQPFKINKPPGVHFPRISCSGVNPATRIYNVYWLTRINILFMRHFLHFLHYVNLSQLNAIIDYYYYLFI